VKENLGARDLIKRLRNNIDGWEDLIDLNMMVPGENKPTSEFFISIAANNSWNEYFDQPQFTGKKSCDERKRLFNEWNQHQYYQGFC
jgi:hypothetical protein